MTMERPILQDEDLQQFNHVFDDPDGFLLLWEDDNSCMAKFPSPTNSRSTMTASRNIKQMPFLPPIDSRPLVARNQFVSQTWLEHIIQHNIPSPRGLLENYHYGNDSSSPRIEETFLDVSLAIHGKTISEILPQPRQADYIDLLEERRPSYQTTLELFAMSDEQKEKEKAKGYSSRHFWRSFLGPQYNCMNVDFQRLQK